MVSGFSRIASAIVVGHFFCVIDSNVTRAEKVLVGSCPLFLFRARGADLVRSAGTRAMQPLEHIRAIAERVAASRGLTVWEIQSRR